jgi:hypothetical protein
MATPVIPLYNISDPKNYRFTIDLARKELAAGCPLEKAACSGCLFDSSLSAFIITMLNHPFTISYPAGQVKYLGSELEPHFVFQLVMMHYLNRADGVSLAQSFIPYRLLSGGISYDAAFQKRAVQPLADVFGSCPEKLFAAASLLGGQPYKKNSVSGTLLYLFPRVPLLYRVWAGDEEFPAGANILFDSTANHYMHTEDLAVAENVTELLIQIHRTLA